MAATWSFAPGARNEEGPRSRRRGRPPRCRDGELGRVHRMKRRVTTHAVDERIDDHVHLLDVIGREAVCGAQVVDGVDCGMGGAAGGVRLDGDAPELPVLAEFAQISIRIARGRREGMVEAAPDLLEDVRRPVKPRRASTALIRPPQAAWPACMRLLCAPSCTRSTRGRRRRTRQGRAHSASPSRKGPGCGLRLRPHRTCRRCPSSGSPRRCAVHRRRRPERTAGDVVADHHRVDELAPRHGRSASSTAATAAGTTTAPEWSHPPVSSSSKACEAVPLTSARR